MFKELGALQIRPCTPDISFSPCNTHFHCVPNEVRCTLRHSALWETWRHVTAARLAPGDGPGKWNKSLRPIGARRTGTSVALSSGVHTKSYPLQWPLLCGQYSSVKGYRNKWGEGGRNFIRIHHI